MIDTPAMAALDLTKTYPCDGRRIEIVRGCSLVVQRGEVVVVRGRSGSGKSTLLNLLGLLSAPDSGRLEIAGRDVTSADEATAARVRRDQIGFVFQGFALLDHLTAQENIEVALAGSSRACRRAALRSLYGVGLAGRASHRPATLSGGEQQRVALARALVRRPALVLADEPTGNLDSDNETLVLDLLRVAANEGCGVVIVSHSAEVGRRADRVLGLAAGVLTAGSVAESDVEDEQ